MDFSEGGQPMAITRETTLFSGEFKEGGLEEDHQEFLETAR
jgi:hypothetical protein